MAIFFMLGVTGSVLAGVCELHHLSDAAREARATESETPDIRARSGPVLTRRSPIFASNPPERDRLMLELAGAARAGVGARRRARSDDGPGALADAGAVRRLGRVFPVRPGPVPQRRQSDGELCGRERQVREVHRSAGRDHRDRAARRLRHSRLGDARRRAAERQTRRSSSASSPNSSRGTSSIRAATACSAGSMPSSCLGRESRSASIAPIRTRKTTSRPSTS